MPLWDEHLSEENKQQMINAIAKQVILRGMATPAIMFLEMNKPISNIMAHGALVLTGFIGPIIGTENYGRYTQLFSDRQNIEQLIQRIEELMMERDRMKKEQSNATR